ncbi:aminotransferase class V-fold PLP-dependent enzyme [Candidatus Micrarchaeota archaeon]|nr:aminotransferase class V-fold PLP-dependent enzyme [Candidatus Micrarchaeota archaeon]
MNRSDFPLLGKYPGLIYLDSACTSLKPEQVIEAEASYYRKLGGCAGRSSHSLGRKTNEKLEQSRERIAGFVNAEPEGMVWTRNTTEALNLLAGSFDFSERKKVVTTVMEHHAVLLPFMRLRDRGVIELEVLGCDEEGRIVSEKWEQSVDKDTALVVTNSGNNTTGHRQDVAALSRLAHDNGALICVDGAQGVAHHRTDFRKEGCDFLCFSAHKMLGPTGIGAFAAKKDLLEKMQPFIVGGGIVKTLNLENADYMQGHSRFEAGIQDYAGIIGFAAACDYLDSLGMENVEEHERKLARELVEQLRNAGAEIYGGFSESSAALCSFNFKNGKPHDVALMLDKQGVALRSGFFCAQPAMEAMGAKQGAVRASGYVYNSVEEIKKFGEKLEHISALYQ